MSYAGIVASSSPLAPVQMQQPVANDVTTPFFNRKANPTKLFSNCHGKEKASKVKLVAAINALALEAGLKETDVSASGDRLHDRF